MNNTRVPTLCKILLFKKFVACFRVSFVSCPRQRGLVDPKFVHGLGLLVILVLNDSHRLASGLTFMEMLPCTS